MLGHSAISCYVAAMMVYMPKVNCNPRFCKLPLGNGAFKKAAFKKAFYNTIITFLQLYNHTIKMFPPFLPKQFYCDICQTDGWTSGAAPAAQAA